MLTPDVSFNETAYEEYGPPFVSTQVLWSMFFDYASYASGLTWMLIFGHKQLRSAFSKLRERATSKGAKISEQFDDQLSVLQRSYEEAPLWWFIALFLAAFIALLVIVATDSLYIPVSSMVSLVHHVVFSPNRYRSSHISLPSLPAQSLFSRSAGCTHYPTSSSPLALPMSCSTA